MSAYFDHISTDELWDILESDLKATQDGGEHDAEGWEAILDVAATLRARAVRS